MALKQGTIVVAEAADFFKGKKLAYYLHECELHENSVECQLVNPEENIKRICINFNKPKNGMYSIADMQPIR